MRITTKFIGSSALLISTAALLSVGGYWVNRRAANSLEASYTEAQVTVAAVTELDNSLKNQITALSRLSVLSENYSDQSEMDRYWQSRQTFFQSLDELSELIPSSDQQAHLRLGGIRRQHNYLDTLFTRIERQSISGSEAQEVVRSLRLFEQSTGGYITALSESANEQAALHRSAQNDLQAKLAWLEALGFCFLMALLIAQYYGLLRPVLASLKQLQAGAAQLGVDEMETLPVIELETGDELQHVAEAFNEMSTRLAGVYRDLENRVRVRTQDLHKANQALQSEVNDRIEAEAALTQTLAQLKRTQLELLQTEKMSSLGQLVAGISHEINNPVSFIQGNLTPAQDYMDSLLRLLSAYQAECPEASDELNEAVKAADLDFMREDFPRLLDSMRKGSQRIREIVESLRVFSRLDESETKSVDIHKGLDSALMLLTSQLAATSTRPHITIERRYGNLPAVYCYPGQLNQVFMGLLTNAIDALMSSESNPSESNPSESNPSDKAASLGSKPTITISTEAIDTCIRVCIADNGVGMDPKVCRQIFDPFFTTKPVGSGMGLGLSMAYQIVTASHRGEIICESTLGKGTAITVEIPLSLKLVTDPAVVMPPLVRR